MRNLPEPQTAREPRVAVLVLNWNGLEDTRACIRSVAQQTWAETEVHVIDNASANAEADKLEAEFGESIHLRRNADNLGFTGGHNGVLHDLLTDGACEYIALLNNDAVAAPDWLDRLVEDAEAHPDCGVFASHMVFFDEPGYTENTGIDLLTTGEAVPAGRNDPVDAFPDSGPRLGASGGAVLYRASMLREIGIFREDFFANFEDVDLSLRALATGWDCRFVADSIVRHHLSRSINKVRDDEFRTRSVRNLTTAYWINVPWPVILLNLPWLLGTYLIVPLVAPLLGQWDLSRILLRGRFRTLFAMPGILKERIRFARKRRKSLWRISARMWWRQRSCVVTYWNFFVDVVVLRRRRYMQ